MLHLLAKRANNTQKNERNEGGEYRNPEEKRGHD